MAEGVGFEPTVGCPTLDFESSALNRTQPPFRMARYCRSYFTMRNCRTRLRLSKVKAPRDLTIRGGCCGTDQRDIEVLARGIQAFVAGLFSRSRKFLKNVTILGLPR
jgi:hypothetical protein